nr:retrovirus-related Pol polyprotein from transposon TNT 1-94 [Tanacetum cinerariifolium]
MQGSGLTEQQQKEILFDQYERFRANGNESIHDYFVRFYKLINDMRITKIQILAHQRNTKFLNNLPSYWRKYVTIVKNSQDISNIVNLLIGFQKQFPPTNNQLRTFTNPMTQGTIQAGQITTKSVQRRAPGNKGKQIATGSQVKLVTCYNCHSQGHIAKECKEKKQENDSLWFKDKALLMEAKEKRVALDAKAEAFLVDVECIAHYDDSLAITTTIDFEVILEDSYDSDVDEAPYAIYWRGHQQRH